MAIPEIDLSVMANIGAQVTSKETYATVRLTLNHEGAGYADKQYQVFLQGSYGNDTNIVKESDVDVVIRLDSIFTYDIDNLPANQQANFRSKHPAATYTHAHFREHVLEVLTDRFGDDVVPGLKAVQIKPRNNRRKTDVLVATQHRKYIWYVSGDERQVTGISFHKSDGTRVVNYPTQHRDNLIAKNQATNEWFKHVIRIFKNARQKLIEHGSLGTGVAPSYYIEGLLYNVPNDKFGMSYVQSVVNAINWLNDADHSKFVCANEQYALFGDNADVTWSTPDCDTYLNGLVELWNGW
jgi:hypothetical protein